MAQVYGRPGAEKQLLREYPHIRSFSDIGISLSALEKRLSKEKKDFFRDLPKRITNEKNKLKAIQEKKDKTEKGWNYRKKQIKEDIKEKKRELFKEHRISSLFWILVGYVNIVFTQIKSYREISAIKKPIKEQTDWVMRLENDPNKVFQEFHKEEIDELNKLKAIKATKEYAGAYGELKVLKQLKKLDNSFHVLCDVYIELRKYVLYRKKRNLKSAQFDFVVVSERGVFPIEVKNWGETTVINNSDFTPHEQVDRAGRVLYIYLKGKYRPRRPPKITKLLISIQNNLRYDPKYKRVLIQNVSTIKEFLRRQPNTLSTADVDKVTWILKRRLNK